MARNVATDPISKLAQTLRRLPGVGPRSAQRMALHILRAPKGYAAELAERIRDVAEKTQFCSRCQNIAMSDPCEICSDDTRDASIVCVVEEPQNVAAIEKTHVFSGLYHVLHGSLSPMEGIGPGDIQVSSLMDRVKREGAREVIMATDPDAEGEATAYYIGEQLESLGIRVTRIARGVPMGGELEYVDEVTLGEALTQRKNLPSQEGRRTKQLAKIKKI